MEHFTGFIVYKDMERAGETRGARSGFLAWMAVGAFVALLAGELRLARQLSNLRADRDQLASQLAAAEEILQTIPEPNANRPIASATEPVAEISGPERTSQRLAQLEQRVESLTQPLVAASSAPGQIVRAAVPEYNVSNPVPATEPDRAPEPSPNKPDDDKRSWGEEQVVGPPNVVLARDDPKAWASRSPDEGPEWLAVQFANIVDVAEVRVRESYNPGAINKVTANINGQEYTLWEGTAYGGAAPRDFVVPVRDHVQTSAITIHLDSARVPGWNEIDAVELVGKDGSRQWAVAATASSTYAQRGVVTAEAGVDFLSPRSR